MARRLITIVRGKIYRVPQKCLKPFCTFYNVVRAARLPVVRHLLVVGVASDRIRSCRSLKLFSKTILVDMCGQKDQPTTDSHISKTNRYTCLGASPVHYISQSVIKNYLASSLALTYRLSLSLHRAYTTNLFETRARHRLRRKTPSMFFTRTKAFSHSHCRDQHSTLLHPCSRYFPHSTPLSPATFSPLPAHTLLLLLLLLPPTP